MRKRYIVSALGIAGVAGMLIGNKNVRRNNFMKQESNATIVNAGIPDQVSSENEAQLDNAKMVSEGSSYGVNYFNDTQQHDSVENNE
ncbi:hypothetical protein ACFSTA_05380 [Ornithinibacillus salinisoli]|uniref:Uncharacterized protein n=1 Tax=Ornithinibacillus salinisoli TaxID=1848459 RepID=A0ABW4VXH5_9BACI